MIIEPYEEGSEAKTMMKIAGKEIKLPTVTWRR